MFKMVKRIAKALGFKRAHAACVHASPIKPADTPAALAEGRQAVIATLQKVAEKQRLDLLDKFWDLLEEPEPDAEEILNTLHKLGSHICDGFSSADFYALMAALEYLVAVDACPTLPTLTARINAAAKMIREENFKFYPDVYDDEDLGRTVFDEEDCGELEGHRFADYISVDYEQLGADFRADTGGVFTSIGYFAPAEGAAW